MQLQPASNPYVYRDRGLQAFADLSSWVRHEAKPFVFSDSFSNTLNAVLTRHDLTDRSNFKSFFRSVAESTAFVASETEHAAPSWFVSYAGLELDALSARDIRYVLSKVVETFRRPRRQFNAARLFRKLRARLIGTVAAILTGRAGARATKSFTNSTRRRILSHSMWSGNPPPPFPAAFLAGRLPNNFGREDDYEALYGLTGGGHLSPQACCELAA